MKKIKNEIAKMIEVLASKSFFLFLFLFMFFLLLSLFLFFQYSNTLKEKNNFPSEVQKFEIEKLEKIIKMWQERREEFEKIEEREYKNPF